MAYVFCTSNFDPYTAAKDLKLYREIGNHSFQRLNAGVLCKESWRLGEYMKRNSESRRSSLRVKKPHKEEDREPEELYPVGS